MSFLRRNHAPSDAELAEAAEQMDAGLRLAFPQLFDQTKPAEVDTPAPIKHDEAAEAVAHLLGANAEVHKAALALALEGNIDLHLGLQGLMQEIERINGEIADRWSA